MNEPFSEFLGQVQGRTKENVKAFNVLYPEGLYGVCIGLLRQELDTLLRLCYLWHSQTSDAEAKRLVEMSAKGEQWTQITSKGKEIRLADRTMVNLASHLGGWEQIIYSFGSKLIHLSDFHLYQSSDPLLKCSASEREEIRDYLSQYHEYPYEDATLAGVIEYLPKVMDKLTGNVEFYIEELEEQKNEGRFA